MAKFPTHEEWVKTVAEEALDEFLFDGKSIREWMQIIASEDAISRQAVLDTISELNAISFYEAQEDSKECYYEIRQAVEDMPSVTPKPKMGHWVKFKEFEDGFYHIRCSECGQFWSADGHAKVFRYCFNCGAKMEVEE